MNPKTPAVEIYVVSEGSPDAYYDTFATLDVGEAVAWCGAVDLEIEWVSITVYAPTEVGWFQHVKDARGWREWHWFEGSHAKHAAAVERAPDVASTSRLERLTVAAERLMTIAREPSVSRSSEILALICRDCLGERGHGSIVDGWTPCVRCLVSR